MEKKHLLHLALALGLVVLVISACSKDDDCEKETYYLDFDKDGYGDSSKSETACKKPEGNYVLVGGDTNDEDANVNPDCTKEFYEDKDDDGFGTGNPILFCENPDDTKFATVDGDTNDLDANINPDCKNEFFVDGDGDGFGAGDAILACNNPDDTKYAPKGGDPDDTNDAITPETGECETPTKYYVDEDDDGYGLESEFVLSCVVPEGNYTDNDAAFDCNDNDDKINPEVDVTYYLDEDGDLYGDPNAATMIVKACDEAPANHVLDNTDCNDGDENVNPGVEITYYLDADDDGYGNSNESDIRSACEEAPLFDYALEGGDCNDQNPEVNINASGQITYYQDLDDDDFGNSSISETLDVCDPLPNYNYALQGGDCDDNNGDAYPGSQSTAGFIINDCNARSGDIWTGANFEFDKGPNQPHGLNANQDHITENVWFTRPVHLDSDGFGIGAHPPIYNYKWWLDTFGTGPTIHVPSDDDCDLEAEFFDSMSNAVKDFNTIAPQGGTKRARWAIVEQSGNTQAWQGFDIYGKLGDSENFYSLNNVLTMLEMLATNDNPEAVSDDFGITYDNNYIQIKPSTSQEWSDYVEGVLLGVYLPDEDIYFTLTFGAIGDAGAISYTRSTPNN
ncbi:hypothetical protein [Flagellimonas sp. S3867]|uniref:hypothetical protein n=1 Tax=Flagellimonas sp. S3867 TaxID=2768063 RepID=UPI0016865279|nr:hypothetical protein [Flagellimonas sp. S3867]